MDGNKAAGRPRQDRARVTAAEWFAGGRRIGYDPGSAHVLTEEEAAATPGALRVFERVAPAGDDADAVWLTLLPGFPDGSYGWAQVDRMLGDGLGPRLYVEPVGQGDSVGSEKSPSRSSTYSHRTGLSAVLKIRVSVVRFRRWPQKRNGFPASPADYRWLRRTKIDRPSDFREIGRSAAGPGMPDSQRLRIPKCVFGAWQSGNLAFFCGVAPVLISRRTLAHRCALRDRTGSNHRRTS